MSDTLGILYELRACYSRFDERQAPYYRALSEAIETMHNLSKQRKGGKMISDGMVRELKVFFKDYKGCRNCKHQPEPMQMCEWGKHRERVELICSGWERKKDG